MPVTLVVEIVTVPPVPTGETGPGGPEVLSAIGESVDPQDEEGPAEMGEPEAPTRAQLSRSPTGTDGGVLTTVRVGVTRCSPLGSEEVTPPETTTGVPLLGRRGRLGSLCPLPRQVTVSRDGTRHDTATPPPATRPPPPPSSPERGTRTGMSPGTSGGVREGSGDVQCRER